MRWNYWHEIEISNSSQKLQILGHYHRRIGKYLDRFPSGTPGASVRSFYRLQASIFVIVSTSIYIVCVVYLALHPYHTQGATVVLFCLSLAFGSLIPKFAVDYIIEMPQALHLSRRPEFAADLSFGASAEALPIAQPVTMYSK